MRISADTLLVCFLGYAIYVDVMGAAFPSRVTHIDIKGNLSSLNKILVNNGLYCPRHSQPWQAALFQSEDLECGGVLIHPQWVLSAAHCGTRIEFVGLGLHSLFSRRELGSQMIRPIMTLRHPGYRRSTQYVHDLMLIKLSKPAIISDTVKTIRMATKCPYVGAQCTVSGWGGFREETRSLYLQCMHANVVFPELCRKADPAKLFNSIICTFGEYRSIFKQENSGGPLVCNGELQGIITGGSTYKNYNADFHISVSKYQRWIQETLKNN